MANVSPYAQVQVQVYNRADLVENLLDSAQYVNLMFVLIGLIKLIFTKVIPIKTNIKSGRCLVPGSRNVNKYDIQADFMRISRIINLNLNLNLT